MFNIGDLVYIEWLDAGSNPSWHDKDKTADFIDGAENDTIHSVGIVFNETKNFVYVLSHFHRDEKHSLMAIPISVIVHHVIINHKIKSLSAAISSCLLS